MTVDMKISVELQLQQSELAGAKARESLAKTLQKVHESNAAEPVSGAAPSTASGHRRAVRRQRHLVKILSDTSVAKAHGRKIRRQVNGRLIIIINTVCVTYLHRPVPWEKFDAKLLSETTVSR